MYDEEQVVIEGLDEIISENTSVDDIDTENINLIFIALDQSGSIRQYSNDMQQSLIEFKQSLSDSKEADEILVARADFDDTIRIGGYKKISEFDTSCNPGGCTALYDVIKEGAAKLNDYRTYLRNEGVRVKSVFAVFSDGEDTSSNVSSSDARNAIAELNKNEITTAFIGFGPDAVGIANNLGFVNKLDVTSSASELRKAFNCLSKSVIESSKSAVSDGDGFFI